MFLLVTLASTSKRDDEAFRMQCCDDYNDRWTTATVI